MSRKEIMKPQQHVSEESADSIAWSDLSNVEYLTEGGTSWIRTAVLENHPHQVVIKQIMPELQHNVSATEDIENDLLIHSHLKHENIVFLYGAGHDGDGRRFLVSERLEGTLAQLLAHKTRRVRQDRKRKFLLRNRRVKENVLPYLKFLEYAKQIASACDYLNTSAFDGSMVLHRDLKPDNIGFALDGTLKVFDFGLSRIVPNSSPQSDETYKLSGGTGSLRYMAPEVARGTSPYNHKADIYSFGIILWELFTFQQPYETMNRKEHYERVVCGGDPWVFFARMESVPPHINKMTVS